MRTPKKATRLYGKSRNYRAPNDLWMFTLEKIEIMEEAFKVSSDQMVIYSIDAKANPFEPYRPVANTRKGKG